MRVCIISGDAVGGVRKHVHDILGAAPLGVQMTYIHSHVSDATALREFIDFQQRGIERLPLHIVKNPALSDLKNIITIWRACRRSGVEVIHGHGAKGGLYARSVGIFIRKPVIFTPHGGPVHHRFGKVKRLIFGSLEYLLKFATTLFIFESQYTRAAFQKLAGCVPDGRELVISNGIDLDRYVPQKTWRKSADREVRLLTVGMLSMVKGQDVVIRAVAKLKARGWRVSLDLCGEGEERPRLESLAVDSQVDDLVRFHGDVDDVRPYYEICDIVVIPSRFESFGYVAVEAALMGRAVVASATGGLLETVIDGETGLGFTAGSPEALVRAVEQTIVDLEATRLRIEAARERAIDLFDVNTMTERLFSVYKQLASN